MTTKQSIQLLSILLGVLFIGLKLGGVIAWPWWVVLLPFYGVLVAVLVALVIIALLMRIFLTEEQRKTIRLQRQLREMGKALADARRGG